MLKGLILTNIQSHKSAELQFSPGMNVIVGPTDSGKSGIIRGLNWALNNQPSGEGLISFWCKNAKNNQNDDIASTVITEDGTKVTRLRQPKANKYTMESDGETLEYGAIGTGVPEQIEKKFNLSDINIQHQHDQPFLLFETAGEVSRTLNRVVKLDKIDRSLSAIDSKKRTNKAEIDSANKSIESLDVKLSEYDGLVDFEKDVLKHEAAVASLSDLTILLRNLRFSVEEYIEIDSKMGTLEQKKALASMSVLLPGISELRLRINTKQEMYGNIEEIMASYIQTSRSLRSKESVDITAKLLNTLDGERDKLFTTIFQQDELSLIIEEMKPLMFDNSDKVVECLKITEDLDKKYSAQRILLWDYSELEKLISSLTVEDHNVKISTAKLEELKVSLPEECPYCGSLMEDDKCEG